MNNYEIFIILITIIIGLLVLLISIQTLIKTRKESIDNYESNKNVRKSKFHEKN